MSTPFDPDRYKNRESARKAAERYARLGRTDLAHAIRDAWGFPFRADWSDAPPIADRYSPDPVTNDDLRVRRNIGEQPQRWSSPPMGALRLGGTWDEVIHSLTAPPAPQEESDAQPTDDPENPYAYLTEHPRFVLAILAIAGAVSLWQNRREHR